MGIAGLVVLLAAPAIGAAPARGALRNRADAALPVTNGEVLAVARSADRIYVGGNFTQVTAPVGPFAALSPDSAQSTGVPPEVSGGQAEVRAVVADGAGGFYIGGSFTHVAGVVRHNAAHILADGMLDSAWDPEPNGQVEALAVLGSTVYLGGQFHGPGSIDGSVTREYLAAVDATTGGATSWAPEPDGYITAIATGPSTVYFAGLFEHAGGAPRKNAAAVDAGSGILTPWNPAIESSSFLAMVVSGSKVYVGGGGTLKLGGSFVGGLSAVDAETGALLWKFTPGVEGTVYALALSGSTLYAGGEFKETAAGKRNNAVAVDAGNGIVKPWDPDALGGRVEAVAAAGSTVYLGGSFTGPQAIGGVEHQYLAAADATTGAVTAWSPEATAPVRALAVSGGSVGVGGTFSTLGVGVPRHNLAAFSALDGSLLPWAPEPDHGVAAIVPDGDRVLVGGSFAQIGGQARTGLAAIDVGSGVATTWAPTTNGTVTGIQRVGQTVYLEGGFSVIDGVGRIDLASVDAVTGVVTPFHPELDGALTSMLVRGSSVYLAGSFTKIGLTPRPAGLAAVDATSGAVLPWSPATDSSVLALAASGPNIVLGGNFSIVNGLPHQSVAAVDGTTAAVTAWDPKLSPGNVEALAASGNAIFIGGGPGIGLVAVDATSGADSGWSPGASRGSVLSLALDESGGVIAGGSFSTLEESAHGHLAAFTEPPGSVAAPSLSGTPAVGQTLSCSEGTWSGGTPQSHGFAWLRDGGPIAGAGGSSYVIAGADGGHSLRCRVTASNLAGSLSADSNSVDVAAAAAAPAREVPTVSGLTIKPASFRAAKHGPPIVPKHYARVGYRLSAPAEVIFTIERRTSGRRRGKTCVKPTAKLRKAKAKKCSRYVPLHGSFSRTRATAGADHFQFSGRLAGRALKPGAYRLDATAVGAGSKPATHAFHILRAKR